MSLRIGVFGSKHGVEQVQCNEEDTRKQKGQEQNRDKIGCAGLRMLIEWESSGPGCCVSVRHRFRTALVGFRLQ
jgi:hypothetical protein